MPDRETSNINSGIKQYSVLIYFVLVFVISGSGLLLVVGTEGFPLKAEQFANFGISLFAATLAGPCIASILLTGIVGGRQGYRDLFTRMFRWRIHWTWYAVAMLPAVAMIAMSMLLSLVSPDFRPTILESRDKLSILLQALGPALLVGSFEEIGWTGFATPQLRSRYSILKTGLIIGVVWGAWHFPLFWQPDSFSSAFHLFILIIMLFSWLPPFRVLLVWLHNRTQSLPVVMLMHAAVSFVTITVQTQGLTGIRLLVSLLGPPVTMWSLFILIGAANRWKLTR